MLLAPAMSEPPAILAIPGLGLGPRSWAPTLNALAGDPRTTAARRVPGYGEPAPRGRTLAPERLAAALSSRMQETSGRVVVFGHSASCQIAAHVAAMNPTRVAGLVLVGPTTDPTAATWPRLITRWLATARHETPRQVPALLRQYRRTGLGAMRRAMDLARRDRIEDTLSRTSARVLVLRGRHDRICPEGWATDVAGCGGAGSRAVTLAGGGHMVPSTHGPLVAAEVAAFLDR
jgi:pimeloyl-ACP methyl ester carboxylesterase